MGVPVLYLDMYIRKKKNKSGSTSVQIISKSNETYKVVKSIGSGFTEEGVTLLGHGSNPLKLLFEYVPVL